MQLRGRQGNKYLSLSEVRLYSCIAQKGGLSAGNLPVPAEKTGITAMSSTKPPFYKTDRRQGNRILCDTTPSDPSSVLVLFLLTAVAQKRILYIHICVQKKEINIDMLLPAAHCPNEENNSIKFWFKKFALPRIPFAILRKNESTFFQK